MLIFSWSHALQPPASALARHLLYIHRGLSVIATLFSQFLKRPPADHTVGFSASREIDWCHRRVAAMRRCGVIQE
jgi:hypothetical protein